MYAVHGSVRIHSFPLFFVSFSQFPALFWFPGSVWHDEVNKRAKISRQITNCLTIRGLLRLVVLSMNPRTDQIVPIQRQKSSPMKSNFMARQFIVINPSSTLLCWLCRREYDGYLAASSFALRRSSFVCQAPLTALHAHGGRQLCREAGHQGHLVGFAERGPDVTEADQRCGVSLLLQIAVCLGGGNSNLDCSEALPRTWAWCSFWAAPTIQISGPESRRSLTNLGISWFATSWTAISTSPSKLSWY